MQRGKAYRHKQLAKDRKPTRRRYYGGCPEPDCDYCRRGKLAKHRRDILAGAEEVQAWREGDCITATNESDLGGV